jgi:hypothetical protein
LRGRWQVVIAVTLGVVAIVMASPSETKSDTAVKTQTAVEDQLPFATTTTHRPEITSTTAAPTTTVTPTTTTAPPTTTTTQAPPPPTTVAAAPQPFASSNGCDPNYAGGCVPIASDVDCASGSGNGPAYVDGPVQVVGSDIYDLDRDHDGIGCES